MMHLGKLKPSYYIKEISKNNVTFWKIEFLISISSNLYHYSKRAGDVHVVLCSGPLMCIHG